MTTATITTATVNDTCTAVYLNGYTAPAGYIFFPNGQLSFCESGVNHSFVKTFQEAIDLIVAWDSEVPEPEEEIGSEITPATHYHVTIKNALTLEVKINQSYDAYLGSAIEFAKTAGPDEFGMILQSTGDNYRLHSIYEMVEGMMVCTYRRSSTND